MWLPTQSLKAWSNPMLNPFKNSQYIACDAFAYAFLGFYVCRFCWSKDGLEMAMRISYFSELKMPCVGNLDCSCTEPVKFCQNLLSNGWTIVILLCPQQSIFLPRDINVWLQYFQVLVPRLEYHRAIWCRCGCVISFTLLWDSLMLWCMLFQNHFCKIYGHTISWWRCTWPLYTWACLCWSCSSQIYDGYVNCIGSDCYSQ